jgi:calmodulin
MREAFKVFDRDDNGYVSREELKRIMSELGDEPLSSEELDVLMNNFDDDGDDRINYDGNVFLFKKFLMTD